ncbi:hypothetical protein ACFVWR_18295 [Leifsonia sp. NPDC058292]|uniref:hypothetical protein n=1 Tax=Leifsonia sp. NPDC058292 TaxID=3346428 RepID=UPI0036D865D9
MTDLLARITDTRKALEKAAPAPLPGQQAIPVATIADHHYEGRGGPCEAEWFTVPCGKHRDAHEYIGVEDA